MKRILITITTIIVFVILAAGVNYFWQQDLVSFFTNLGMHKIAGFVSGPWWNSLSIFLLSSALLTSIWLTYWQLQEGRKGTNAHTAIEISRELQGEDNISLLNEIYSYQPQHLENPLTNERIRKIERAINRLSTLGILVANRIVDERLAIRNIAGTTVLRCWYQLHTYIKNTQSSRGYFAEDFEDFARRSLDYFKHENIQVLFAREGETQVIDLVTELQKSDLLPRNLKEITKNRRGTTV